MKALILKRYGGLGELELADISRPVIKPDEILVKVHAAGINPVDCMIPKGQFKPILRFTLPATMGSDVAGEVVEVGARVTRFKAGDAVFGSTLDTGVGTFAEYAAVQEQAAAHKPANLDFIQAASLPMVTLTAWQALVERARLKPGERVLIPAGAGGIGTFAIQLAKHLGATVGTTTSTGNVDLVRSLGADEIVDYKKQAFETVLRDYDVVLGTLRGDSVEKTLQVIRSGSRVISLVGPPDRAFARTRNMNFLLGFVFSLLSRKMRKLAQERGGSYAFLFARRDGEQLAQIGALFEAGHTRPVIDRVFPLAQAKEAMAYVEQGRAKGKVVLQMI